MQSQTVEQLSAADAQTILARLPQRIRAALMAGRGDEGDEGCWVLDVVRAQALCPVRNQPSLENRLACSALRPHCVETSLATTGYSGSWPFSCHRRTHKTVATVSHIHEGKINQPASGTAW